MGTVLGKVAAVLVGAVLFAEAMAQVGVRAADEAAKVSPEPRQIVEDTVEKVTKILGDPAYQDEKQKPGLREKVRQTILGTADMDRVGGLTLAQYRGKFSDEQFRRFSDLFSRLVFTTYISHLEKFNGQKIVVTGTQDLPKDCMLVKTKTLDESREIPVDFSFVLSKGAWSLYDMQIEGVSLVKNYRSQFTEILLNKKPEQLIEQIAAKVKKNEAEMNGTGKKDE